MTGKTSRFGFISPVDCCQEFVNNSILTTNPRYNTIVLDRADNDIKLSRTGVGILNIDDNQTGAGTIECVNANHNNIVLNLANNDIKLSRSTVNTLLIDDNAGGDATLEVTNIKADIISEKTGAANIRINNILEIGDADNTIEIIAGNVRWSLDGGDRWDYDRTVGIGGFGQLTFRIDGAPNPEYSELSRQQ